MSLILQRQKEALNEHGIDALLACSPKNVSYSVGFSIPSHTTVPERHAITVVTQDRDVLLVVNMEAPTAKSSANISEFRVYAEFEEHPMDVLANMLREMGLSDGKIAIEMSFLSITDFSRLEKQLPQCRFVPSDEILYQLRQIKTEEEIRRLRKVAQIADGIHNDVYSRLKIGDSERKLGGMISDEFILRGGDKLTMLVVTSGERSGLPNGGPTDRIIEDDTLIRVDILGTCESYYSDIARTVFAGTPNEQRKETYKKVHDTHMQLLDMVKAGVYTAEIYKKFSDCFTKHGFPVSDFVGHGIGVDLHEGPLIGRYGNYEIKENMVVCIEPFIFHGIDGYHIEDMLLVTKGGYEKLNNITRTDEMLTFGS